MNYKDIAIRKENVLSTFFIGWVCFLASLKLCIKPLIMPLTGQLFGIFLVSLAPILEYREMINVAETPDGWLYLALSVSGVVIFVYSLWRFFVLLAGVNLLARDIYDDRAIANLSFYTSDVLRKKWSYIRFLAGYLCIGIIFAVLTAGVMFLEYKIVVYNFITSAVNIILILAQTILFLVYVLFTNIAVQGYTFNRIIGFEGTIKKIGSFIKENVAQLAILSFITVLFSNMIAYLTQFLITFIIISPFNMSTDNSAGIAIRFTIGFLINAIVVILLQFIYARFYLVSEK